MTARVLCLGAGGHARVIVDSLQMQAHFVELEIVGVLSNDPADRKVLDVPVVGSDEALAKIIKSLRPTHFVVAVGSTKGGEGARVRLFGMGCEAGLEPFTIVHPSATIARSVALGAGAQIMAGAIIQPGTVIGRNVIVNTGARIDHDCDISDHAHIAPGVTCAGRASVGMRSHIGAGATILQNIRIGSDATVGAGATVVRNCENGVTVVGTPATAIGGRK